MAKFDSRNLALTVHAIPRRRLPCEIGYAIDAWANGGRTWTWSHRWIDGPTNRRRTDVQHSTPRSRCVLCGKSVREILDPPMPERRPREPKRPYDAASMSALQAAIESGN